jgi:hypothetical protein
MLDDKGNDGRGSSASDECGREYMYINMTKKSSKKTKMLLSLHHLKRKQYLIIIRRNNQYLMSV